MPQTPDNSLITQPIPKLIKQLSIPASVGFFFHTLYNVVDTYFAGNISTEALAALSISFPVFFILLAVSFGCSSGATALIGSALGAGDNDSAKRLTLQALSYGLFLSVLVAIFGYYFLESIFIWLNAEGLYLQYALQYSTVIFLFGFTFVLGQMLNAGLNAKGWTKYNRNALIFSFFLNLILDPWFIYGGFGLPAMGVAGIAWATIIAQSITFSYLGYKLFSCELLEDFKWSSLLPNWKDYKSITQQGVPATGNMMAMGVFFFVANQFLSQFGKEAVAAYGIGLRMEQLILVTTIGINIATLSLVAQNHGAKRWDRLFEIQKLALFYATMIMVIGSVCLFLFSRWIILLFTSDPLILEIGISYLMVEALVLPSYALLHVNNAVLQGLKRPNLTMYVALVRSVILPFLLLQLCNYLNIGYQGLWWTIFICSWGSGLFIFYFARRLLKNCQVEPLSQPAVN